MDAARRDCLIPSELVPKCPVCGGKMAMNLRCDNYFVEDEAWHEAADRYADFLNRNKGKKIVLLELGVEKGNMCDLSRFPEGNFDYILNPTSLMYVPDVKPVFKECYRVLKKGGIFIMMAPSPVNYLCDYIDDERGGYYKAVNRMPYCSADADSASSWIEYGHTMEDYLGGQIESGFVIDGYRECQMEDITELYFLTKAVK